MKLVISVLLLSGLVCGAFAQNASGKSRLLVPGPYTTRDRQLQPVLLAGVKGLYVLNKGVLARFDAATLALQASKELFAPLPEVPAQGDLTPQQQQDLVNARVIRLLPAAMALHGADLVALIGDQFVRVDPLTLDIKVSKPLHTDTRPDDFLNEPARELTFAGDSCYTVHVHNLPTRGVTVTAINSHDGTLLAEKALPQPLDLPIETWGPQSGGPTPPCSCLATADGVYVLRCGALAKLDPRTLEPLKVTELYGAVPTIAPQATPALIQAVGLEHTQRLLPSAMLIQGGELVIVQGDDFFLVNLATQAVRHGSLMQTSGDARTARINELSSLGAPRLQQAKYGACNVIMTRGKECFLLTENGMSEALPLPESMTRSLPLRGKTYARLVPKDGEKLNLTGVLWQDAAAWHLFAGQYGEFLVTGDSLAKLKANAELAKGQVMVQGTFHKGTGGANAPLGTLELTGDVMTFGTFPLFGTLQQRKLPGGEVWTVSGLFPGDDYVLTGDKVKALAALPEAANRQIFVMGKYSRQQEKMPQYGQGYISVDNYSFPPDPAADAAAQDKLRPVLVFTVDNDLYALRNGVIARFHCTGATAVHVNDLLPDASKIPGAEQIPDQVRAAMDSERTLRIAAPLAFPLGNELAVFIPGAGYFRLDSNTLEQKANLGAEHYPFPIQSNNTLFAAQRLYAVSGKSLLTLNIADGSMGVRVELPKVMVENLFP